MADLSLLHRHKESLDALWQTFRDFRKEDGRWPNLLRRRDKIILQPELADYAAGIDIQSSVLEEEAILRKHILVLNPAKVDCVAQEKGKHIKDDVEDVRIWMASLLMEIDDGMRVSDPMSADQVMYGVSFWRKTWTMPTEPDDVEGMSTEEREEYFQGDKQWSFGLEHVPVGSLMYSPLTDPTVFLQEVELDFTEWRELKNKAGKYAKLDEAKKVGFTGDEREADTGTNSTVKLKVMRHAYKEPDSGTWKLCEWLVNSLDDLEGEAYDEYECPMGPPFEVCPGGEEMAGETDPHLRFRPQLYPLYTVVNELNYAVTTLMVWARKRLGDQSLYVEVGAINEAARAWLTNEGIQVEGAGAQNRLVFTMPEPGSRQIMVAPKLSEVPLPRPEELILRIQMLTQDIDRLRSNRFLTGAATPEEITQGTATAITGQAQQARIPFSASVRKQSGFWKRFLMGVRQAIIYWDEEAPKDGEKLYYVLTSGEEPIMKGKVEPGDVIHVNATKMKHKFETLVYIRNVTEEEQAQRDARALVKYDRELIDKEQLLDEMGFDDPGKQLRVLNKEKHRRQYAGRFQQISQAAMDTLLSAMSGINLALIAAPPEQQGAPPQNGNMPTLNQAPQAIQPPPMQSPDGGSGAMAGMMV